MEVERISFPEPPRGDQRLTRIHGLLSAGTTVPGWGEEPRHPSGPIRIHRPRVRNDDELLLRMKRGMDPLCQRRGRQIEIAGDQKIVRLLEDVPRPISDCGFRIAD